MEGHAAPLVALINARANLHHEDYIGFNALMWAREEKHTECIDALEQSGAVASLQAS